MAMSYLTTNIGCFSIMQPILVALLPSYGTMVIRGDVMENYTVLIIDLIKSRSYKPDARASIQNYIVSVIRSLNAIFSGSLAKDVDFSAGDEIQGLFSSPQAAYLYLRMFCMLIFPVEIRAGIGIGEWNVRIENASTTAQDGPAYHNARYAMGNVKDALGCSVLFYSGEEADLYLNALVNASFTLTGKHSEYQNELMLLAELLYPIDYHQAINRGKINQLLEIIALKSETNYYKRSKSGKRRLLEKIEILNFKPVPIDAAKDEDVLFVSSGKKRGMNTQLAEILNISRQSIEKTMKAANIYEIRNLTIAALKFMNNYL